MATRSWNRVELIGNLTRDPEVRFTPQGTPVATFSIATNRTYVSDGERKEEADFHRIVAWSKLAELCGQLLKKGNRVFVSGRLQNRSWEGQDGQNRQTTEIVIEDMILLTQRSSEGGYSEDFNEDVTPKESKPSSYTKPQPSNQPKDDNDDKTATSSSDEPKSEEKEGDSEEEKKKSSKVTEVVEDLDDLPF